jgi:hypothetical protein
VKKNPACFSLNHKGGQANSGHKLNHAGHSIYQAEKTSQMPSAAHLPAWAATDRTG